MHNCTGNHLHYKCMLRFRCWRRRSMSRSSRTGRADVKDISLQCRDVMYFSHTECLQFLSALCGRLPFLDLQERMSLLIGRATSGDLGVYSK